MNRLCPRCGLIRSACIFDTDDIRWFCGNCKQYSPKGEVGCGESFEADLPLASGGEFVSEVICGMVFEGKVLLCPECE
jgi:hypothetical protein